MKLKQIYVLEDQGKYYYVKNNEILRLNCSKEEQNPDGLLRALLLFRWNPSLAKAKQRIDSRVRCLGESQWSKKLQSIAIGLKDREKAVRRRTNKQGKEKYHTTSFETAMNRCVNQANARTRRTKWKRWCNNASSNMHKRMLRKGIEA